MKCFGCSGNGRQINFMKWKGRVSGSGKLVEQWNKIYFIEWSKQRQLQRAPISALRSFISILLLFVFGWAAVISSSLMREDEQPTQPNQLLAFISAAIGGCWLIKERVGELPLLFLNKWVMSRRLLCRRELPLQQKLLFSFHSLCPCCSLEEKKKLSGSGKKERMKGNQRRVSCGCLGRKPITLYSAIKRFSIFYGGGKQLKQTHSIWFHQTKIK